MQSCYGTLETKNDELAVVDLKYTINYCVVIGLLSFEF